MSLKLMKDDNADFYDLPSHRKEKNLKLVSSGKLDSPSSFYKVVNPDQLAKIGRAYLEDYKKGMKSFAFASTSYKAAQQRTVLGIATYFEHLFDLKILIVSDCLQKGIFEDMLKQSEQFKEYNFNDQIIKIQSFYHHFDFLNMYDLMGLNFNQISNHDYLKMICSIIDQYDLVFWDTPIIDSSKKTAVAYSHIMNHLESVTLVVSPVVTKSADVKDVKNYFSSYGINIKGVIFDSES